MQGVLAYVHSYLDCPLDIQHEPGLFQAIPKGWALAISIATAPAAPLSQKAELKASRNSALKVHGEGLLIPSLIRLS